jgi:NAD(P)-dependent dehydrogenase (short-subunit alcohol dehydrogenase family)
MAQTVADNGVFRDDAGSPMSELDGKVILITGSSTGIGAGTALTMARHGAAVVVNHRNSPEKAEAVARSIRDLGREALVEQADVTDRAQVQRMVASVMRTWGRIDVLVNNVGHAYYKRLEELTPEDWVLSVDENLTSQIICLQAVLPHMLERQQGRIILVSSISAQRGSPSGDIAYTACKAGILAMTKTLASSYAKQGLTVNAVAPGIIDAGLTDHMAPQRRTQAAQAIPLGRLGRAEEVGEVIAFLASDRASYVTGQVIAVNGGLYM